MANREWPTAEPKRGQAAETRDGVGRDYCGLDRRERGDPGGVAQGSAGVASRIRGPAGQKAGGAARGRDNASAYPLPGQTPR